MFNVCCESVITAVDKKFSATIHSSRMRELLLWRHEEPIPRRRACDNIKTIDVSSTLLLCTNNECVVSDREREVAYRCFFCKFISFRVQASFYQVKLNHNTRVFPFSHHREQAFPQIFIRHRSASHRGPIPTRPREHIFTYPTDNVLRIWGDRDSGKAFSHPHT